ncbi:MAG: DUF4339 domain-containing protein [Spirochaetaceae bacterium]|jgi:hypothetical protein|nr:DUF4339 domain-containing protein [Spirochaetaceae bacterium]
MYDEHSFYSIDRLIEFGLGMGIAQQMVQMMNHTMANMHIPGAGNPMPQAVQSARLYYAVLDGKQAGPFSETEMARLIADKKIVKETYIWYPGLREWKTAENVPEILRLVALTPPEFGETK